MGLHPPAFVVAAQSSADFTANVPPLGLRQEGQGTAPVARVLRPIYLSPDAALCSGWQADKKGSGTRVAIDERSQQDMMSKLRSTQGDKLR